MPIPARQSNQRAAYVPGHNGHEGNEEANQLARYGSSAALEWPKPNCKLTRFIIKTLFQIIGKLVQILRRTETDETVHPEIITNTNSRPAKYSQKNNQDNNKSAYSTLQAKPPH